MQELFTYSSFLTEAQVSEKFLHSEVNLVIQYLKVQDKDRQNINTESI